MKILDKLKSMMEGDVASATQDISAELEFRRTLITGTMSQIERADNLSPDGQLFTGETEFVCTRAAWGNNPLPSARETVKVDGEVFYVLNTTFDPAAVTLRLKQGT